MEQCSFLVNGTRSDADAPLTDGDRVDVLPPSRVVRMSDSSPSPAAIPPILPEYPEFSCAAVVVAGGQSSRLGHVPKASLSNGTNTLLGCALQAVRQASPRVVVGPDTLPVPSDVLLTREDPPFSGPAAAIHAGLERVAAQCEGSGTPTPKWCLILGVDTPRIAPAVQLLMRTAAANDATARPLSHEGIPPRPRASGGFLRASTSHWWVSTVMRASVRCFQRAPPTPPSVPSCAVSTRSALSSPPSTPPMSIPGSKRSDWGTPLPCGLATRPPRYHGHLLSAAN